MVRGKDTWNVFEAGLFNKLNAIRHDLAELENVSPYSILSDTTLVELATYLPHTKEELGKISGFTKAKIERYEKYFREAVVDYCLERGFASRIHLKTPPRRRDLDTKQVSLDLFNQGYSITEIADRRGLKTGTIETHLAHYVRAGKLTLKRLVPDGKVETILSSFVGDTSLTAIKERLGNDYSYGEIRMVLAYRDFLRHTEAEEIGARG